MTFKSFLDEQGLKNIPEQFIEVMDDVVAPQLIASYAIAPSPPVPAAGLPIIAAAALASKSGGSLADAAGASAIFSFFLSDVTALIYSRLTAGAASLLTPAAVGVPGGPISPIALALIPPPPFGPSPDGRKFAVAAIKWAVSLLPAIEPRLLTPLEVV